ncbi:MAG: hypothetical protein MJ074_07715 [Oscillospiraceae bacterium]|nr:hypothetical protein [Oscillospiraceae bacterium]
MNISAEGKIECLRTLRDALKECAALYTALSEGLHDCSLAKTEEDMEAVDRKILEATIGFKHIEIIG